MSEQKIKCVQGIEPRRDGEYPECLYVGFAHNHVDNKVHRIEVEEQNLGTYGIVWYVGYREDGSIIKRMNASHVSSVEYFKPEEKTDADSAPNRG